MKAKVSVFIATSLDGFISRLDGSLDWLDKANTAAPSGEDCGYRAFMNTVDVLVMGRNTYQLVLSFGKWPYGATRVIVLSSKGVEIPIELKGFVSSSSESPTDLLSRLSASGAKHVYIDGGVTIQRFLQAGLVDEITITLVPVILGEGKPLFGAVKKDIELIHLATETHDFGYVQLKYGVRL